MASLIDSLVMQELPTVARSAQLMQKSQPRQSLRQIYVTANSTQAEDLNRVERPGLGGRLAKSMLNVLDGPDDSLERLAFERDPNRITEYAGIYRPKLQGIPDSLLKRMVVQDDLVAAVVHTRANHIGQFGRKQGDRHQKGFKFVVDDDVMEKLDQDKRKEVQERAGRLERLLSTCGHTTGWSEQDKCSFAEYLYMSTRNVCTVGRMATEIVWTPDPQDPGDGDKRKFHSFRPVDAGTIYYAAPYHESNQQVREAALHLVENLKNEKLKREKFENDKYAWVQVFEGRPMQAFGPQEMLVHSPYQVTDIEQMGYPITPLDTAISAVTTHINITHHNRLYFQSGRASRGMLVIKSNDIDGEVIQAVKQQFNASINSVQNAWRMPVFGINTDDDITWQPIDTAGGRDAEFQYLTDSNARTILAAYQMSPEELPGYQHLSRGTNNQALSEGNEEYKLTAARDVGIRPLLSSVEDFLNGSIVPLIDPELAKIGKLRLFGLDVDTAEKESVRLQQDMGVWMTFNDVLTRVEKKSLPKFTGADIPLNPTFGQTIQQYMTFGQILEHFCGVKGASQHADKQFYQNPFWFNFQQMQQQAQAMQQQAAAQQQQPGGPPGGGGGGAPQGGAPGGGEAPPGDEQDQQLHEDQRQHSQVQNKPNGEDDLGGSIDQLVQMFAKSELSKGERNLPASKKRLRARNALANRAIMDAWKQDQQKLVDELASIAAEHVPGALKT